MATVAGASAAVVGTPAHTAQASGASASIGPGLLTVGGAPSVARQRTAAGATAGELLGVVVVDGTGSHAGWSVSATGVSRTLQIGAAELGSPAASGCLAGSTCTLPTGGSASYPVTLPFGPQPPTPVIVVRAQPGTGMGGSASSAAWSMPAPGWDDPATGSTTWIVTLASAP